jgi:hypothetical protein
MSRVDQEARLYLNDKSVGTIQLHSRDGAWIFGDFQPSAEFCEFAPLFGQWSLLIHADGDLALSDAASDELRQIECDIDRLHARLFMSRIGRWFNIMQINIDGTLIECKLDREDSSVTHLGPAA